LAEGQGPDLRIVARVSDDPRPLGIGLGKISRGCWLP
jgi:hypothetical protein